MEGLSDTPKSILHSWTIEFKSQIDMTKSAKSQISPGWWWNTDSDQSGGSRPPLVLQKGWIHSAPELAKMELGPVTTSNGFSSDMIDLESWSKRS